MDLLVVGLLFVVAVLVAAQISEATFGEAGPVPSGEVATQRRRGRLFRLWRRATPDRVVDRLAMALRLSPILGLALVVWAARADEIDPSERLDGPEQAAEEEPDDASIPGAADDWPPRLPYMVVTVVALGSSTSAPEPDDGEEVAATEEPDESPDDEVAESDAGAVAVADADSGDAEEGGDVASRRPQVAVVPPATAAPNARSVVTVAPARPVAAPPRPAPPPAPTATPRRDTAPLVAASTRAATRPPSAPTPAPRATPAVARAEPTRQPASSAARPTDVRTMTVATPASAARSGRPAPASTAAPSAPARATAPRAAAAPTATPRPPSDSTALARAANALTRAADALTRAVETPAPARATPMPSGGTTPKSAPTPMPTPRR